ncbi:MULTISPECIES: glutathione S-transferase family protein [unclassified Gemella]|uniref:glutathione S-transferase family protein n=1 Tax=unclassified Gemella TaxID=2624949 RepID=UPI0015D0BCF1|nr:MULTISPECIES: glutathione S-transferase family protein [unclassified Gemella]MBF0710485.1 glutathione S-transferase family protein [Gemella sp. GL1.1]NYS27829.1 glutathione S-transferase family protein [Gemella sp. GL1]
MGLLVDGKWLDKWYDTKSSGGRFIRTVAQFRNTIEEGGKYEPEKGRYHLYVSLACPWAHRTLIVRKLKGLENYISLSIVNPYMLENGWTFEDHEGVVKDPIFNASYLHQVYTNVEETYSGRVTVPILFDKKTNTIVNNESAEIIRIMNTAFNHLTGNTEDYYPESLRAEIDEVNRFVYNNINNGVYKVGFSTAQDVYEEEVDKLFSALDKLEERLEGKEYLVGNTFTEADIRLFTTLVRFDPVYFGHFKCNIRQLKDYKNLWAYTRRIYNKEAIKDTVNFNHIKAHYYGSHKTINPTGIVPKGPELDWKI